MNQAHLVSVPDRIEAESLDHAIELFFEKEWTDGLPIVPPTEERVREMLAGVPDRDPEEVIGTVPPRWAEATVQICAVNAVMAGCLPKYMPVLLAGVEAALDPAVNLRGIQATTHVPSPMLVIIGPARAGLVLNAAYNVFGQGVCA